MNSRIYTSLIFSGVLGFFIGCGGGGGSDSDCQPGSYLCPCLNGVCQAGLMCNNNFCVGIGGEDTTGPGDGDGDSGPGDGDGDGDSGPGDGDGDTNGDGDGDSGPGDGDGDTNGDGDGDPDDDNDGDGVPNAQDNCPADHNPNQLDFDDNGDGNTCDVLVFNGVSGSLQTTLIADAGFVPCEEPVSWNVSSGTVSVQLDDSAAVASFEIDGLGIADFSALCEGLPNLEFGFYDSTIVYTGGPFPVDVAHSLAAHTNGTINGSSNGPHPMVLMTTGLANAENENPEVKELVFDGQLSSFVASVSGGGSSGTLSWNAPNVVTTQADFITIYEPIQLDIELSFRGLSGSLNLSP